MVDWFKGDTGAGAAFVEGRMAADIRHQAQYIEELCDKVTYWNRRWSRSHGKAIAKHGGMVGWEAAFMKLAKECGLSEAQIAEYTAYSDAVYEQEKADQLRKAKANPKRAEEIYG